MRLLFDQNLSFRLVGALADAYPGSDQVRLLGLDQAPDAEVFAWAGRRGFTIVSQDADYADLVGLHGPPPKVVWLRCGNRPTAFIEALLRRAAVAIRALDVDPDAACLELYA